MNPKYIKFKTKKREYSIPNRWELLSPAQFRYIALLLAHYAKGNISTDDVRLFYVCFIFKINPAKITDVEAMANLIVLASHIDFIFNKKEKVNICFLGQLVPHVRAKRKKYHGYTINTAFDTLTCSLTAAQFIEAQETLKNGANKLPLLASILYCPGTYSSEKAHKLADKFLKIDPLTLQCVALNFQALVTYLFTRTHFSLLSTGDASDPVPEIATGLSETMYNLSADGMGDVEKVKQMPLIEFLTILRKKLIESVRAMHDAQMDIVEIADKTKLSTQIIKKML